MINRQQLLNDLKALLKRIETDLRERAEAQGDAPEIHKKLTTEYERARKAERTAATFEQWRSEQIMQKGVAWILSCVFARFLEDNQLVDPPRIAGPKDLLKRARDEHELYFRNHPKETDREYLLDGFSKLSNLPGGREIFGKHNAIHVYPGWLSGDAAGELLTFFQAIDPGTGELVHDFTDGQWDTRFLGDLYQDLSEAARKKYALLQTPDFVEAFILDRTLEPALDEFGLNAPPVKNRNGDEIAPVGFRMIDPACGSGHFLLGTFDRIFERLLKTEPAANSRDLAQRTLNSIYGVDVNPFAVAIAKFRLLLLAMKACKIGTLSSCPAFVLNVACGDSLLHGEGVMHQMEIAPGPISHCYETEDAQTLRQILKLNIYHAVVANPPYIAVKDHLLNQAYRDRFRTCYGKYALSVPFMQRIFYLGVQGVDDGTQSAGYTGQITANSFMKRQFGKKLVEEYIQNLDLTHVIDTSGAYIPGHGTPTVIIFGRNRKPIGRKIRTAMGIRGEPGTPTDPAKGKVWSMILKQIDSPDSESLYVSVTDIKRFRFYSHPWSIGGGGASELKDFIDLRGHSRLSDHASNIGVQAVTLADEAFAAPGQHLKRYGINTKYLRPFIEGDSLRHWIAVIKTNAIFPYEGVSLHPYLTLNVKHRLWPLKTLLTNRKMFRRTQSERGLNWFEYGMLIRKKYRNEPAITFSSVATHNHFVYLNSNAVFTQSAPLVLFRKKIGEDISLGLLGTLNTALACFWMKQVFHCKGSTVDNKGARQTTVPFEDFYDFDSTKLKKFPILANIPSLIAKQLQNILQTFPIPSLDEGNNYHQTYNADKRTQWLKTLHKLIFLGEELDWQTYHLYELIEEDLTYYSDTIEIELGQRAFEIVMARKMAAGELETTWFDRHNSTPITESPKHWPEDYKQLVQKRIKAIEENPRTIGLIEQPEYKRRWNLEPWDSQLEKALKNWLLDRLESYFDFDGRMNDEGIITSKMDIGLTTTAHLADIARTDDKFMEIAELFRNRPDFDVPGLVEDLVDSESVPFLPACRYKFTGMDKRASWERTWQLQRIEDAIDSLFDAQRLSEIEGKDLSQGYKEEIVTILNRLKTIFPQNKDQRIQSLSPKEWLEYQAVSALTFVTSAQEEDLGPDSGRVQHKLAEIAKDVKNRLFGDIPVPPKYATKDFQSTTCWRLRGKLDVPKERWVSFPYCEGEDQSMLIAWAGYNHLQLAQAIAAHYVDVQERTGGSEDPRLEILLCCMMEILPWIKQWHNDIDPEFNIRMGYYYQGFLADEARQMGKTIEEIEAWQPPMSTPNRKRKNQHRK